MKRTILGATGLLTIAGFASATSVVAYWPLNSNSGGYSSSPDSFPLAAGFGNQAGQANITFGGGILSETVSNGNYRWFQSFNGTTTNARFDQPSGGSLAIQNGTNGGNRDSYIEFNFDASALQQIVFSFAAQRTNAGFDDVSIAAYDGGTFMGFIAVEQAWASSFAAYSFSTSLLDGVTDAVIRMTFNGGTTSSTGNNRFDNFLIEGTEAVVVIPLPGVSGLALAGFGLCAIRRRR